MISLSPANYRVFSAVMPDYIDDKPRRHFFPQRRRAFFLWQWWGYFYTSIGTRVEFKAAADARHFIEQAAAGSQSRVDGYWTDGAA
jgi:hypothetical protein